MSLLSDFAASKERVALYRQWISTPIGQDILAIIQDTFLRPILPGSIGQEVGKHSSAFCLGENAGAWKVFDAFRSLADLKVKEPDEPPKEVYTNKPVTE